MRTLLLFPLVALTLGACVPDPPGAGTANHVCRHSWPSPTCDDGLACVDDTCVPCGGDHMACCAGSTCDDGFACDTTQDTAPFCQSECGLPGLPCCGDGWGECPGPVACDTATHMCEGTPSDVCQSGSTPVEVWVIDGSCGVASVVFMVDSVEQAAACRDALISNSPPDVEVCAIDQLPEEIAVCRHGLTLDEQYYLPTCSDAHLAVCETFFGAPPDVSWTTGDCP